MTRSQWRSMIVVRLLITLLFAPAILDKLIDPDEYGRLFTTWGYPSWGPLGISIIEIIGLVALWIPTLSTLAIVTLVVATAGAIGTWLIHGPQSTAAYPGTILVLIASLAWLQRAAKRTPLISCLLLAMAFGAVPLAQASQTPDRSTWYALAITLAIAATGVSARGGDYAAVRVSMAISA